MDLQMKQVKFWGALEWFEKYSTCTLVLVMEEVELNHKAHSQTTGNVSYFYLTRRCDDYPQDEDRSNFWKQLSWKSLYDLSLGEKVSPCVMEILQNVASQSSGSTTKLNEYFIHSLLFSSLIARTWTLIREVNALGEWQNPAQPLKISSTQLQSKIMKYLQGT